MGLGNSKSVQEKRRTTKEVRDRAMAAIVGAFVADAATLPLHHVEGQSAVDDLLQKRSDGFSGPEFYPFSESGSEETRKPRHSVYANETFPLMESITRVGFLDLGDAQNEYLLFYNIESNNRKYSDSMNHFIEARKKGIPSENSAHMTDLQFTAVMKVVILVSRYAGSPMLMKKVTEVVTMTQGNPEVLVASKIFARLLEKVVLGGSISDSLLWALYSDESIVPADEKQYLNVMLPGYLTYAQNKKRSELRGALRSHHSGDNLSPKSTSSNTSDSEGVVGAANEGSSSSSSGAKSSPYPPFNPTQYASVSGGNKQLPFAVAAKILGTDGTVPECLHTSLYALTLNSMHGYEAAVRANIYVPGDNVCRSWIIGSMLAAEQGMASIPVNWKNRTTSYRRIESLAKILVGSNQHFDSLTELHCVMPSLSILGSSSSNKGGSSNSLSS